MTTHYAFRLLGHDEQLAAVWAEGGFLARRYEEEDAVQLCLMVKRPLAI